MVETIFDTLNAKAAVFAIEDVFEQTGARLPVMISGTITDASGRTLSGQTAEAFWYSLRHTRPLVDRPELRARREGPARARRRAGAGRRCVHVSTHPNAGLPNAFGGYDETPEDMAATLREFAASGLLNFVGGCCGTTPDHIRAIARGRAPAAAARTPALATDIAEAA